MKIVNNISKKFGMPYHVTVRALEGFNAAYNKEQFSSENKYYAKRDEYMKREREVYSKTFGLINAIGN